jgi:hypothetical protein
MCLLCWHRLTRTMRAELRSVFVPTLPDQLQPNPRWLVLLGAARTALLNAQY